MVQYHQATLNNNKVGSISNNKHNQSGIANLHHNTKNTHPSLNANLHQRNDNNKIKP